MSELRHGARDQAPVSHDGQGRWGYLTPSYYASARGKSGALRTSAIGAAADCPIQRGSPDLERTLESFLHSGLRGGE